MPNGFPCPNPTCTQVFPADTVKGASALTCPRCGTVYQFRNSSAAPSKSGSPRQARPSAGKAVPAAPAKSPPSRQPKAPPPPPSSRKAPPPPPPPVQAVVAPIAPVQNVPVAPPVQAAPTGLEFASSSDVVVSTLDRRKSRRRRGGAGRVLRGIIVVLLVVGAFLGVALVIQNNLPEDANEAEEARVQKTTGNFTFKAPAGWKADSALRKRMHVNLAMTRKKPQRSHMSLFYRDFKTRAPRDAEMLDVALKKLRGLFPDVTYEDPLEKDNKVQSGELSGEAAMVLEFASESDQVPIRGQCVMLTRQGYAYWLFTWGPEEYLDDQKVRWNSLREGFQLLNEREGWRAQPRKSVEFPGKGVPYMLNYVIEVWRREENPKDYDDKAELALRGFEPVEDEEKGTKRPDEYAGKAATIQVLVLAAEPDLKKAAEGALEHVRKRLSELNPDVKIEPVKDRKTDKPLVSAEVGALRGQVSKLRVKLDPDTVRYGVLAVVKRPEGVVAIYSECKWERQTYWEGEFKALLETVRLKEKSKAKKERSAE